MNADKGVFILVSEPNEYGECNMVISESNVVEFDSDNTA